MEKDFGEVLAMMRLVAEGARTMFENELSPLYGFLMKNGRTEEALVLDTIGIAIHVLEQHARELHTATVEK